MFRLVVSVDFEGDEEDFEATEGMIRSVDVSSVYHKSL